MRTKSENAEDQIRQFTILVEAMEQYILRLRQIAYGRLDVRRRAMREIDEMDLAGKVECAQSRMKRLIGHSLIGQSE